jgi:hypothetical protein
MLPTTESYWLHTNLFHFLTGTQQQKGTLLQEAKYKKRFYIQAPFIFTQSDPRRSCQSYWQPSLVANLSHACDTFSYRACNMFCPSVVILFWDGYTCVGILLSVIVIATWRYHFELYILMSFVLSLHLPPCFSYLIFVFSGSLRNILLQIASDHLSYICSRYYRALISYIRCNWVYSINKYMVSWMYSCSRWVSVFVLQISKVLGFFAWPWRHCYCFSSLARMFAAIVPRRESAGCRMFDYSATMFDYSAWRLSWWPKHEDRTLYSAINQSKSSFNIFLNIL